MKSLERRTDVAPSASTSTTQSCPSLRLGFGGGLVSLQPTECLVGLVMQCSYYTTG